MFTVSLIGPDGVGKTTIARRLEADFSLPVKYLYMGLNPEASNYMLPTTRWWENRKNRQTKSAVNVPAPGISATEKPSNGEIKDNSIKKLIKGIGLMNRMFEEWYRQLVAYYFVKKGNIVVFDRHFVYDFYFDDIVADKKTTAAKKKLHGLFLKYFLSEPDMAICLDAPGEVVFKRKGEFTPEFMELRRNQYLSLKKVVKNFAIVDANRELESVVRDVSDVIQRFHQTR